MSGLTSLDRSASSSLARSYLLKKDARTFPELTDRHDNYLKCGLPVQTVFHTNAPDYASYFILYKWGEPQAAIDFQRQHPKACEMTNSS